MIKVNGEIYQFTVFGDAEYQHDIKLEDIEDWYFFEGDHDYFWIRKYDREERLQIKGDYLQFRNIMTEYQMMKSGLYYLTAANYAN